MELEAEKDMPIEKLLAKYNAATSPDGDEDHEDVDGEESRMEDDQDDSEGTRRIHLVLHVPD